MKKTIGDAHPLPNISDILDHLGTAQYFSIFDSASGFHKKEANLSLQPEKCEFLFKEISYLGDIISDKGVKPVLKKIEAVQNFPKPKNQET